METMEIGKAMTAWFRSQHEATETAAIVQMQPAPYVTVKLAAAITGLSRGAIYRKIEEGKWLEGREFRRSPDGGIFISMKGYQQWVERGRK